MVPQAPESGGGGGVGGEIRRCGFVAVTGRPNVGKSTLANALAGEKASIVSRRRQTTRGVIRCVCRRGDAQLILLDSPGWQASAGGGFNERLNEGARWAAEAADVVVFMTAPPWTGDDDSFLRALPARPAVAAVNKADLVKDRGSLLPFADELRRRRGFAAIVPLSAKTGEGLDALAGEVRALLPESPALFDGGERAAADRDFMLGELLREKLFRALGEELPYRVGVLARGGGEAGGRAERVNADVYVERASQKAIVLGAGGMLMRRAATAARRDMERMLGRKVHLEARVLVRPAWRRDASLLARMRVGAPQ